MGGMGLSLAISLFSGSAEAADTYLYFNSRYISSSELSDFRAALTGMGATLNVTSSTSYPTSYSGYDLVIFLLPDRTFNGSQANALKSFVEGGGRLVLSGDWASGGSGFSTHNNYVNSLLTQIGSSAQLTNTIVGSGCNSTSSYSSDTITDGVSSNLWVAASTTITGGSPLISYGGRTVMSVDQTSGTSHPRDPYDVVISGDVNFFSNYCSGATASGSNWTVWENLYLGASCSDADLDGYMDLACGGDDCDDTDPSVYPGATEYCDGWDEDCDTVVDEDAADESIWYFDADSDSYGDSEDYELACSPSAGFVNLGSDCDDTNPNIYPGADEYCDEVDEDCDENIDEDALDAEAYYQDLDEDGFGNVDIGQAACDTPEGYVEDDSDCDDLDPYSYPGADEYCDEADNDCDSIVDEESLDAPTWYSDADGDSYGDPLTPYEACEAPEGYLEDDQDCDDTDPAVYPEADEYCDEIDNDCDTVIDEDGALDAITWYADSDLDSFGDASVTHSACELPSGYVGDDQDCDDSNAATYPGADEYCDEIDNDCDTVVDEDGALDASTWYADVDTDGFGDAGVYEVSCASSEGFIADDQDCDDADPAVFPGADEYCDEIDNDCDTVVDEDGALDASTWYADADSDGFGDLTSTQAACELPEGYLEDSSDCDDTDATVYPEAPEYCDEIDNDCDTVIDEEESLDALVWYLDADGDGYGWADESINRCEEPTGYAPNDEDCDDTLASVYPGAPESPYDGVDQDCDGEDLTDYDGDGYDAERVGGGDCDDTDEDIYPGAPESMEGVDEDCDDLVDEGSDFDDADGDGFTEEGGDCDDEEEFVYPDAEESCDAIDEDCDGVVDEGTDCYDDDGDGWTEEGGDCHDGDPLVSPGAEEVEDNGVDDDCDGTVDDGRFDPDGDGYLEEGGDCDEDDPDVHPGAEETPDGVDEDCDDIVDEGTTAGDDDGDGWTEEAGDCNDADPNIGPGQAESWDGVDEDCDGEVDEGGSASDDDGDGLSEVEGDCDDSDPNRSPGLEETPDGVDEDCDGAIDEDFSDLDGDGYTSGEGDCDDEDGWANPGMTEVCDAVDNDCDGVIDEGCEGVVDAEPIGDTGLDYDDDKGCSAAGSSASAWWLLVGAGLLVTRRRSGLTVAVGGGLLTGCSSPDLMIRGQDPQAMVSPTVVELEPTPIGVPVEFSLEFNAVDGDIEILSAEIFTTRDYFEILDELPLVPEGESASLRVRYLPEAEGYHYARMVFMSDTSEPELTVSVLAQASSGRVEFWPQLIDFGQVLPGEEASAELTLLNAGELDWSLESVTIEENRGFGLEGLLPIEVSAGEEGVFTVTFKPEDEEPATSRMFLSLGDYTPGVELSLYGNACEQGLPSAYDQDGDGVTPCGGDCDDGAADTYPEAPEIEDGADQDCDDLIDEGTDAYDDDGDGLSESEGDCNDEDPLVGPGQTEDMDNGQDDDCDGVVDLGASDPDGDGYTEDGGDCSEGDELSYPGAEELDDGLDNDCDSTVDEGTSSYDDDGDGYTEDGGDCHDGDEDRYPDAEEAEDGVDNDCDSTVDEGTSSYDDDGDGYTERGGDCDDSNDEVGPHMLEVPDDGIDNDCDGDYS